MSSKFDFGARIKATSYDDLTGASGAQPSDAVRTIPIAKLHPFKMHPFKVLDNEDMEALTESVKGKRDSDAAYGSERLRKRRI